LNLLLDTNVISKMIRGQEKSYRINSAKSLADGDVHTTSVVVKFELEYGAINGPHPVQTRLKQAIVLARLSKIYDFTVEDADIAAEIRVDLENRVEPIGEYDVLIAAQAIRTQSIMVTNNKRHFYRVTGLHVIDWSKI
jgi:tRNA(fMet)-specific endonuclease VapC